MTLDEILEQARQVDTSPLDKQPLTDDEVAFVKGAPESYRASPDQNPDKARLAEHLKSVRSSQEKPKTSRVDELKDLLARTQESRRNDAWTKLGTWAALAGTKYAPKDLSATPMTDARDAERAEALPNLKDKWAVEKMDRSDDPSNPGNSLRGKLFAQLAAKAGVGLEPGQLDGMTEGDYDKSEKGMEALTALEEKGRIADAGRRDKADARAQASAEKLAAEQRHEDFMREMKKNGGDLAMALRQMGIETQKENRHDKYTSEYGREAEKLGLSEQRAALRGMDEALAKLGDQPQGGVEGALYDKSGGRLAPEDEAKFRQNLALLKNSYGHANFGSALTAQEIKQRDEALGMVALGSRTQAEQGQKMLRQLAATKAKALRARYQPDVLESYDSMYPGVKELAGMMDAPAGGGAVRKQYNPKLNKTRIIHPDGKIEVLDGKQ